MKILLHSNDGNPQTFSIGPDGLSIGRKTPVSPDSPMISLDDTRVSRVHAKIYLKENRYFIENLGKNGTSVNDHLISEPVALNPGDRILIAGFLLEAWAEGMNTERSISQTLVDNPQGKTAPLKKQVSPKQKRILVLIAVLAVAVCGLLIMLPATPEKPSKAGTSVSGSVISKKTELSLEKKAAASRQAVEEAQVARKLFEERNISAPNRHFSMVRFRKALALAQESGDSLLPLVRWTADSTAIFSEMDSIYQDHRKKTVASFRQGNTDICKDHLQSILEYFPDPKDERNLWARNTLLSVSGN